MSELSILGNIPTALLYIGIGLIILVLLRMSMRRKTGGQFSISSPGKLEQPPLRDDLDKLIVEIQQVSSDQIARMDTKMRMINQLIKELDEKKREVEQVLNDANALLRKKPAEAPKNPQKPKNPLHEKVYRSVDNGKSVEEICNDTGMMRGEVELILGMRNMDDD